MESIEVGSTIEVQFNAPCTLRITATVEVVEGGVISCRLGMATMLVDAYTAINNGEMWYQEENAAWVLEM